MMYWVKGMAVNMPLVMWRSGVGEREVFSSPRTRIQFYSEPVPLDWELHTCLFFFPLASGWTGLLGWTGVWYITQVG